MNKTALKYLLEKTAGSDLYFESGKDRYSPSRSYHYKAQGKYNTPGLWTKGMQPHVKPKNVQKYHDLYDTDTKTNLRNTIGTHVPNKDRTLIQKVLGKNKTVYKVTDEDVEKSFNDPEFKKEHEATKVWMLKNKEKGFSVKTAGKLKEPTAVIIKGNPKWVEGPHKAQADSLYREIENQLKAQGYKVTIDPGLPYTSPPKADLWVAHSRGSDRLRFAPKNTKTIKVDDYQPEFTWAPNITPPDSHYKVTDSLIKELKLPKQILT